jgi:hypothetical protein
MKLTTDEFINKALSLPTSFFSYSLESLIDTEISDVKELLKEDLVRVEPELTDEIGTLIDKITQKEHRVIEFFYNILGIEKDIDGYRRRLKYLFDFLQTKVNRLEIDINDTINSSKKVKKTLKYLEELKRKLLDLYKINKLIKNKIFIKEIEGKILLLENYNIALSLREVNLLEMKKIYKIIEIKGY